MSIFVHLTSESNLGSIQKNGIKPGKIHFENVTQGIFCMPVINDFLSTHQWLREIKRFSKKNIVGVYFKIPDNELVWCGLYSEEPKQYKANEAVDTFMKVENRLGFQVVLPRKLFRKEVLRIKHLPQMLGWRYYPNAHEKKLCFCPACLGRGEFNTSKIREQRYYDLIAQYNKETSEDEQVNILSELGDIVQFSNGRIKDYHVLLPYLHNTDSSRIVIGLINVLTSFNNENVINSILQMISSSDSEVKNACVDAIFQLKGVKGYDLLIQYQEDRELLGLIKEYRDIYSE